MKSFFLWVHQHHPSQTLHLLKINLMIFVIKMISPESSQMAYNSSAQPFHPTDQMCDVQSIHKLDQATRPDPNMEGKECGPVLIWLCKEKGCGS